MCHVFGDYSRYRMSDRPRLFTPPAEADFQALQRMHTALGIDHAVLVQPTCYEMDHSALLDALAEGGGRHIGVGIIDDSVDDVSLEKLNAGGVQGARFHSLDWLKWDFSLVELRRHIDRIAPLGWHIALHVMPNYLVEHENELAALEQLPIVIDHMCWLDPRDGVDQPAMKVLERLQARGNWYIRLSNTDRLSSQAHGFTDVIPLMRKLVDAAPQRAVWGTDWAHTMMKKTRVASDREILELLYEAFPDEQMQRQILVTNPQALYSRL